MQNYSGSIIRPSLGQVFSIGSLYDARKDAFIGVNIFNQTKFESSISCQDNPGFNVVYETTDCLAEKFNKFNISAELQLSILAGMVSLEGSANYLREEKASAKAGRMTLLYSITTKSEGISIFNLELKELIDLNAIDCTEATHVVIGIDWGANCTVTAEYENQQNDDQTKVKGLLKAELDKVAYAIKGEGEGAYENTENQYKNSFSFRSNCDIVTTDEELPITLQQTIEFVKKLPKLVTKANNGKGKPLSYHLLPISSIVAYFNYEKKIDLVLKQLKEESILRFVHLFEEISLVRQELYDLYQDVQLNSSCLSDQQFQLVTKLKNNFAINEANLRSELAQTLVDVRSGRSDASKLDDLIKEFEEKEFSTVKIRDHLQSFSSLKEKIKHIKILLSKGIDYIGKSGSLDTKFMSAQNQEFYVLFLAWSKNNEPLWNENLRLFLSLVNAHSSNKERYGFIIVDCDLNPENTYKNPVIFHYVNGQSSCEDVLKMNKEDASLCLAQSNEIEDCLYPPNKRTPIELPCPGSLNGGICENLTHQWLCKKCRNPLEYGFDDYFYCSCGKGKTTSFQYRCNSPKHGSAFISYTKQSLKNYLEAMRPMKEINILILGETGVGKSTWINAIANYVMYQNLAEAEEGELISMIDSSFTMTNDDYEEIKIKVVPDRDEKKEGHNSNENLATGQSSTQIPTAYILNDGNKIIRLIDTPGIGDTRGIEQDKKNFDNILHFISKYKEIDGICILLKPNNANLTVMFRFCIKELLTHLHRSAAQNIVFCFTNSRSTFYKPGDTLPALRILLEENRDVEIPLVKRTIYCMDNEPFRFLAAIKNDIKFGDKDRQDYTISWDRAVEETKRLFDQVQTLKPHKVLDTLSLNSARKLIVDLSEPIAKISQNIQKNIAVGEDKKKEIESFEGSISDLQKKMYIPYYKLEARKIDYPRTVCTSPGCIEIIKDEDTGSSTVNHTTHCHEHCYLEDVAENITNNMALKNCSAMDENDNCKVCGCPWFSHQHITYEIFPVLTKKIDANVKNQMETQEDRKRETEKFIQTLDEDIRKLKNEQEIITKASAKFAYFLKQNAISAYNDALGYYLDHLIREEKNKIGAGGSDKTLLGLEKMKRNYDEQVKILDDQMNKKGEEQVAITPDDIDKLKKELFALEINGKELQDVMDMAQGTRSTGVAYQERPIKTRNNGKSDGFVSGFTNAVLSIFNPQK